MHAGSDQDDERAQTRTQPGLIARGRRMFVADATRDARNIVESARLVALVVLVSVIMGGISFVFLWALSTVTQARQTHLWLFALLPVVAMITAWLYRSYGLQSNRGNNLVIDSALTGHLIHFRMAALTFCCSIATHLSGGSAGREGTAVQIGGTVASNVSGLFHLGRRDHHDLTLAGVSAAFGGVFGTPLAGALFGMEMCYVGKIDYSCVLYCLVASFTGDAVARLLGAAHETHAIVSVPGTSLGTVAAVALAAVVFGLVARLFSFGIRQVKRYLGGRFRSRVVAALAGSLALLACYALASGWSYGGLSDWLVDAGFKGATTPIDAGAKLFFTVLTLGCGFQGGEVTPLFGIGAALGGWIGSVTMGDPSLFAALGMLGVFGGALNVPLTTIMLGIDLFGGRAAAYYVITSFVSYLITGHHGVYPAQRIVTPKRRSLSDDASLTVEAAMERHDQEIANELGIDGESLPRRDDPNSAQTDQTTDEEDRNED